MRTPPDIAVCIGEVMRADRGRLVAGLIRALGDFQLAEDALQDAAEAALLHWARAGVPDSPRGWLMRVAHRKAIDRIRREGRWAAKRGEIAVLAAEEAAVEEKSEIADERLRLIFTCCHPALAEKSRVALTLRLLGGLSTGEVARAFLDERGAMAARITRAKAKVAAAGIAYEVPEGAALGARLHSVLGVIYLIYNEGYAASAGEGQLRVDLCEEALFLARMLVELAPGVAEAEGLLALILLSHARRAARAVGGAYVPLDVQDRGLWDMGQIAEGSGLVERALGRGQVGPYQLQAAIAALHCAPGETDWPQIVALYQLLARMQPGPVVALNLAVARGRAEGAEVALAALAPLAAELQAYQPYHAARADLLARLGRGAEAHAAYGRALALSQVESERAFLRERRAGLSGRGRKI